MPRLPLFCYEKAFKLSIAIVLITISGLGGIAWGMIMDNDKRSSENKLELAKREQNVSLIPTIHENQIIMCTALDVECK